MRKIFITLILVFYSQFSQANINIFACEPEWAALTQEIVGDHAEVYSATNAKQDAHYIRARPSLLAKMRSADLVFCSGADLEVGWLPILLQKAGKESVQPGTVGYLMAADHVELLEKPVSTDRSHGHLHEAGNPHVHLNPHNITVIARELLDRLEEIDADRSDIYQKNHQRFIERWQQSIQQWEQQAKPLINKKIITHHASWSYLVDWLSMELVTTLEPKPGLPPTISHLQKVLESVANESVIVIIRAPYDASKASQWLTEKSEVRNVVLPYTVGGSEKVNDLFDLYDITITELLKFVN